MFECYDSGAVLNYIHEQVLYLRHTNQQNTAVGCQFTEEDWSFLNYVVHVTEYICARETDRERHRYL